MSDVIALNSAVDRLRRRGLDPVTCRQLQAAGVACGGLKLARELLAGGDGVIAAVAAAQRKGGG